MGLPAVMVAPNGARLGKADHPNLPVTLEETLACARACHAAGAGGLHLHLRDAEGHHLLDAGAYAEALTEFKDQIPGLMVQITTEAAGVYAPVHQRHVALTSGATHASISIREMAREPEMVAPFYTACAEAGLTVQHILFDLDDARLLKRLLPEPLFKPRQGLQLLFVLGRYAEGQRSDPAGLEVFLDWMSAEDIAPDWALCAFGQAEFPCLLRAAQAGGKCRVGFENSRVTPDGAVAESNASQVRDLCAALAGQVAPAPAL